MQSTNNPHHPSKHTSHSLAPHAAIFHTPPETVDECIEMKHRAEHGRNVLNKLSERAVGGRYV